MGRVVAAARADGMGAQVSRSTHRDRGAPTLVAALALACGPLEPPTASPRLAPRPAVEPSSCAAIVGSPRSGTAPIPFGIYSPAVADFAALAADGFTMVGPWYVPAPDRTLLDAAAEAGLAVVFPVGYDNQRFGAERTIGWDEATIRAEIGAAVDAVVDHPAIAVWYVMPEELRYWRDDELAYLRIARETILAHDPQQRPIVGYQPNDRDAEQLRAAMPSFDIVAKGTYANYSGFRDRRAWVRWSTAEQVEAAGPARDSWVLPEMFEDPSGPAAIDAWARHDVLAALLGGADGVLVYSGWRRPTFAAFDAYRAAYASVARELNGAARLGAVLRDGVRCRDHTVEQVDGPAVIDFVAGEASQRWPSIDSVELRHGDATWLWLVNSAAEPVTVRVTPPWDGELASGAALAHRVDDRIWIAPWGVVGLRR